MSHAAIGITGELAPRNPTVGKGTSENEAASGIHQFLEIGIQPKLRGSQHHHIESKDLDVHSPGKLPIPETEFYVIYTGDRQVPPTISFGDVFGWKNLDLTARVISSEDERDIIGQYIIFAHVFDAQVRKYGRVKEAIEETLRICRDRGVLKEYLDAHEKEVLTVMMSMFDQEKSVKRYGQRMAREEKIRTLVDLVEDGTLALAKAAEKMGMTTEEFKEAVEQLKVTV